MVDIPQGNIPSALNFLSSDKPFSTLAAGTSILGLHHSLLTGGQDRKKTTVCRGMGQDLLGGQKGFPAPLSREANGLQVPLQRDDMHGNRVKFSH